MAWQFYAIVYGFTFWFATSIGSFLNVIIYRVPLGISVAKGRSFCPHCHTTIKPYDLIPLLSYALLGGRCRHCKTHISLRYSVVEGVTGFMGMFLVYRYGLTSLGLCVFALFALLLVMALIDIDTMEIPNGLVMCFAVLAIPFALCQHDISLWERLFGFFIISLPMTVMTMAIPNAFGGGDIKLMAACGLILGYQNTLFAMFIGVVLGGLFAMYFLRTKQAEKGSQLCFGPYLGVGIFVAQLFGSHCIAWYLTLL